MRNYTFKSYHFPHLSFVSPRALLHVEDPGCPLLSRDTRNLPIKKAVLSVACLYSVVTLQPKPISVWSGSSSSSELSIFPIHQSGTKPTYLHTLALLLSPPSRPSSGWDSRLSEQWLVCRPVCLHGLHSGMRLDTQGPAGVSGWLTRVTLWRRDHKILRWNLIITGKVFNLSGLH